jgi:hypothetical protein
MRQSRIEGEEISDAQATADRDNGADMARVIVVGVDGSGPGEGASFGSPPKGDSATGWSPS